MNLMLVNTNLKRGRPAPGPEAGSRRREIVEASIGLIAKGGIQALTTKNLAESLGVTEPALYRHFKSKRDILLGILELFKDGQRAMHARPSGTANSPLEALDAMIGEVFRNFVRNPAMVTIILAEGMFQNDRRLSRMIFSIMEDRREGFARIIGAGQGRGEIRDDIGPDELALLAMGAMRLLVTRWRLSGFAFDLEAEGARCRSAIRAILAIGNIKRKQEKEMEDEWHDRRPQRGPGRAGLYGGGMGGQPPAVRPDLRASGNRLLLRRQALPGGGLRPQGA
jgi:AcrR family transcriptional regulator